MKNWLETAFHKVDPKSTTHKIAKTLKGVWGFSPRRSICWLLFALMVTFRRVYLNKMLKQLLNVGTEADRLVQHCFHKQTHFTWKETTLRFAFNAEFKRRQQRFRGCCRRRFTRVRKFLLKQQLLELCDLLMESGDIVFGSAGNICRLRETHWTWSYDRISNLGLYLKLTAVIGSLRTDFGSEPPLCAASAIFHWLHVLTASHFALITNICLLSALMSLVCISLFSVLHTFHSCFVSVFSHRCFLWFLSSALVVPLMLQHDRK